MDTGTIMSVVVNLSNLTKKKQDIIKLSDTSTMTRIGSEVLRMNQEQISRGVDENDKKFKPYSESYQRQIMAAKAKISPKGKWKGSGKSKARLGAKNPSEVNLTVTGAMLADFGIVRVERGEVEIGFHSIREKQKASGNVKIREFVGLTKKNERALFDWIKKTFLGRH
jgi:hypothetical protein